MDDRVASWACAAIRVLRAHPAGAALAASDDLPQCAIHAHDGDVGVLEDEGTRRRLGLACEVRHHVKRVDGRQLSQRGLVVRRVDTSQARDGGVVIGDANKPIELCPDHVCGRGRFCKDIYQRADGGRRGPVPDLNVPKDILLNTFRWLPSDPC